MTCYHYICRNCGLNVCLGREPDRRDYDDERDYNIALERYWREHAEAVAALDGHECER